MTTKPSPAKLPPNPEVIADLQAFRDFAKELVLIGMTIARAIGEQVNADPRSAEPTAPAPAETRAEPRQEPAPNPRAEAQGTPARPAPPARQTPATAFATTSRAVNACIDLYMRLSNSIATAHTTAEFAGLNHPARQPILDYIHEQIRFDEPYQLQRMEHREIEIRVSEELAYAPNRNPGDIIAELCTHYQLPHNPDHYPNNWRPTRDWAEVPGNPPPQTDIRPPTRPDPEIEDPDSLIATILNARSYFPNL